MLIQLNPPIPVKTPKGDGLAHIVIDYGPEHDLLWVVFIDNSGECWTYPNPQIRAVKNITMGRVLDTVNIVSNEQNGKSPKTNV